MRQVSPFSASEVRPRTIRLFAALSLAAALLKSLVNLPAQLSVGEQAITLGVPLPLYSLLAVLERAVTVGAAFLLVGWLVRHGRRSGMEWWAGAVIALPLLFQLARLADGTAALLLAAVVLRRWLPFTAVAGLALLTLMAGAWLSSLPVGEWSLLGISFSVTETTSLEEVLTGVFLAASSVGFALFALELALKLAEERELLQQALVQLETAREQERRLLALEERTALSRELHDTIGHHMTALNLHAQRAEIIAQQADAPAALTESLAQVRAQGLQAVQGLTQVVSTLREEADSDASGQEGVAQGSLFAHLEALCQRWPAPVTLKTFGQDRPLPEALRLTAYRTCQEALTNASKHAPGQMTEIQAECHADTLRIEAVNALVASRPQVEMPISGYGLRGLRERAQSQGGTLEAREEQGTFRLCLTLPLPPA